ncbi:CoA-binding protein [Luedemannella helvata]|uniref:CoA-binding protein n=1 Tax=Luedemannella helvata TaxID=349315 RepID=A0ABN2JVE0_9ACTN
MDGALTGLAARTGETGAGRQAASLAAFFEPATIAVVGATDQPGKLGTTVMRALIEGPYAGRVVPVNPRRDVLFGLDVAAGLADIQGNVDLVFVCVGDAAVPDVLRACADRRVAAVVVLNATLGPAEETGALLDTLRAAGTRVIGPNCMGVYSSNSGVSWTPRAAFDKDGGLGLVSHSGGMAQDLLLSASARGLGVSVAASLGNCCDVDEVDVVEYLTEDERTGAIGMYLEGTSRGPALLAAIASASATKPVVCMKGGRDSAAAEAVATHTGRIAGDYRVWEGLLRQAGAYFVNSPEELLDCLALVGSEFVDGPLCFVGNGGGASVLLSDLAAAGRLPLARLADDLIARLEGAVGVPSSRGGAIWDIPLNFLLANDGDGASLLAGELSRDAGVGRLVLHLNLTSFANQDNAEDEVRKLVRRLREATRTGNRVLVLRTDGSAPVNALRAIAIEEAGEEGDLPCFNSIESLMQALTTVARHRSVRAGEGADVGP